MAKFQLDIKVKLEIVSAGKTIDSFDVTYKELTRKEGKSIGKENKEILELFNKSQLLEKRVTVLEGKIDALKELERPEDVLKTATKLERLYDDQANMEEEFEKLGGLDKLLEASKLSYEASVAGKDKNRLTEFVEAQSDYSTILAALKEDANEQKGKH